MFSPPQGMIANSLAAGGFSIKLDSSNRLSIFASDGVTELLFWDIGSGGNLNVPVNSVKIGGFITRYNNINTATNTGVAVVYVSVSSINNAALVSNAINYPPPATAGTYRISAYVNVRTAAAVNMAVTVAYKDAAGIARSELLALNQQNTTTVINNMNNTIGRFTGSYIFHIDNSATAITLSTTGTTMTLYDLAATLEQLA